jgi:hypothetical protein
MNTMIITLKRLIVGAFLLTLLLATSPISADTIYPAIGDRGNASFDDHCPANQYMIGLTGRAGVYLDRIAIICSPVLPSGLHGPSYVGPSHGGAGGTELESSCPNDSFVYQVDLLMTANRGHVASVGLHCGSMKADRQQIVYFQTTDSQGSNFTRDFSGDGSQECHPGELASGFNGHYGKDVNALGLDCADRTDHAANDPQANLSTPRVSNARDPIRTTGVANSTSRVSNAGEPIKTTGVSSLVCPQGYVWREASPRDHVCVTPLQRRITAQQNAAAAARVSQTDTTYGPNTCVAGYVWREAFVRDVVCVTPAERDAALTENANAPPQIPR